jgi:hypothetical protein
MNAVYERIPRVLCWIVLPAALVTLGGCNATGAAVGQDLQAFMTDVARQVLAALLL